MTTGRCPEVRTTPCLRGIAGGGLLPIRSVGLDDAALRGADEFEELVAVRTLRNRSLHLVAAVHVVQSALEEDAACLVDLVDALLREVAPAQSDFVRSEERRVGKGCRSRLSPYH